MLWDVSMDFANRATSVIDGHALHEGDRLVCAALQVLVMNATLTVEQVSEVNALLRDAIATLQAI